MKKYSGENKNQRDLWILCGQFGTPWGSGVTVGNWYIYLLIAYHVRCFIDQLTIDVKDF